MSAVFVMGRYGADAVRCTRDRHGVFITVNERRIAKRLDGDWISLDPEWNITPKGPAHVELKWSGGQGVILPFRSGS